MQEFLYKLKLIDRLQDDAAWTAEDSAVLGRHVQYLLKLLKDEVLILAGRTLSEGANRFGIVILRASDEASARRIMESDPAVAEGIMTSRLFPYKVAWMEGRDAG